MDAITEVEKLNAALQLTMTIIPSSMVNMMSNEEDWYFQCQEPGHIAQHCPHIRCHKCDEYGYIVMDYPHKIPPSGTLAPHHKAHGYHHTRWSSWHHQEDWERRNKSRSQSRYSRHCSHCHLHRGFSRSQQQDRHSNYRSLSRQSNSGHQGHSHRPCHDIPHWPHCKSSTQHSSSGYHSQDCSRSHSHPPTDHPNIIHTKEENTVRDHTPIREPESHTLEGIGRSR